jgi:hypothetical protein
VEYKEEEEQVPLTCTICAALAYLPVNKVEGWLIIMDNFPKNEKLTLFVDYFVEQSMQNQNVPIEMWNINKHRHRINNAVKGWSFKANSVIGKQQRNVFLLLQKLKQAAELVSGQLKSKEPGQPGQKRRKTYVKRKEIIKRIK